MFHLGKRVNVLDTDELKEFFDAVDHADEVELLRMRAAWLSVDRKRHEEAWAAVRAVGVREGLSKEIDGIRKRALAWASRGNNDIPYRMNNDETWAEIKMEAAEAIVDAALGISLGDRLDAETRETLLASWGGGTEASR
jgi:hypothetical protein